MQRFVVRRSTESDIRAIHAWLLDERRRGIEGNFLCNWNLTLDCHKRSDLWVCADSESGEPVGYHWGDLLSSGVLQVRSSHRGQGIGRMLVESSVARALRKRQMLLHIHCTPSSSIPFWTKMGFQIYDDEGHATRILSKRLALPRQGASESVEIQIFPEARKWSPELSATRTILPTAKRLPGGVVRLGERVAFFDRLNSDDGDPLLRILVGGEERYFDKAKYGGARKLGVKECHNGWYIDVICP